MKLLEVEGKALLAAHGLTLPRAATWPLVPESARVWVVKAQTLAGGRGKRGGAGKVAPKGFSRSGRFSDVIG